QRVEHAALALRPHGLDERLVAVAQIDRAPDRRLGDGAAGPLAIGQVDRLEGAVFLNGHAGHGSLLFMSGPSRVRTRPRRAGGSSPARKTGSTSRIRRSGARKS